MPMTEVIFCQEAEGRSPVVEWLEQLRRMNAAAFAKGTAVIQRLAADGHALRRTTADILRDGIHELRAKHGRVNYRILYFFHGRNVAILAHGITKEAGVPPNEVDRAIRRKLGFAPDPDRHTYRE